MLTHTIALKLQNKNNNRWFTSSYSRSDLKYFRTHNQDLTLRNTYYKVSLIIDYMFGSAPLYTFMSQLMGNSEQLGNV